jgi:hypothetical protein
MIWPDNSRYEGEFVNSRMEGKGTKIYANQDTYEGMWKDDLQHGPGIFTCHKTGKQTNEEWREGKRWTWMKSPKLAEKYSGSRSDEKREKWVGIRKGESPREPVTSEWVR